MRISAFLYSRAVVRIFFSLSDLSPVGFSFTVRFLFLFLFIPHTTRARQDSGGMSLLSDQKTSKVNRTKGDKRGRFSFFYLPNFSIVFPEPYRRHYRKCCYNPRNTYSRIMLCFDRLYTDFIKFRRYCY